MIYPVAISYGDQRGKRVPRTCSAPYAGVLAIAIYDMSVPPKVLLTSSYKIKKKAWDFKHEI